MICFNEVAANCVAPYIKEGSVQVSESEWKVPLFVTDPERFRQCLKSKYEETMIIWGRQ